MKMFKKIISITMVISMIVSFAACTQNADEKKEEGTKEEKITITVDEAEKVVEDFLKEGEKPSDFKDYLEDDADEVLSDNAMEQIEDITKNLDGEPEKIFNEMSDFKYEIISSEEKDDKIIVKAEISNIDLSEVMANTKGANFLDFLNKAVKDGIITVEEGQTLYDESGTESEMSDTLVKLARGKRITEKITFTVTKAEEKVMIDDIDDANDLFDAFYFGLDLE